jgi:hypothetical protein
MRKKEEGKATKKRKSQKKKKSQEKVGRKMQVMGTMRLRVLE